VSGLCPTQAEYWAPVTPPGWKVVGLLPSPLPLLGTYKQSPERPSSLNVTGYWLVCSEKHRPPGRGLPYKLSAAVWMSQAGLPMVWISNQNALSQLYLHNSKHRLCLPNNHSSAWGTPEPTSWRRCSWEKVWKEDVHTWASTPGNGNSAQLLKAWYMANYEEAGFWYAIWFAWRLGIHLIIRETGIVVHTCNPSTQEVEAWGSCNLGYIAGTCLKNKQKTGM
jgi:hypothetical protein